MDAVEGIVGVQATAGDHTGSGQTWTPPDACAITLDVYPPNQWRADRVSSAATIYALQLAATDQEYEVTRVKSPVLGRDMNPMGRGDGYYYPNGGNAVADGSIVVCDAKSMWTEGHIRSGFASSVNNQAGGGGGGGW